MIAKTSARVFPTTSGIGTGACEVAAPEKGAFATSKPVTSAAAASRENARRVARPRTALRLSILHQSKRVRRTSRSITLGKGHDEGNSEEENL